MLTAIRAPEELFGKSLGSAIFAGRLAAGRLAIDYNRKSSGKDWLDHFQMKKHKTRQIWPRLEEFFSR